MQNRPGGFSRLPSIIPGQGDSEAAPISSRGNLGRDLVPFVYPSATSLPGLGTGKLLTFSLIYRLRINFYFAN